MKLKQIIGDIKKILSKEAEYSWEDAARWIDEATNEWKHKLEKNHEKLIAEGTAIFLNYEMDHGRPMTQKMKLKVVQKLLIKHGLLEAK